MSLQNTASSGNVRIADARKRVKVSSVNVSCF